MVFKKRTGLRKTLHARQDGKCFYCDSEMTQTLACGRQYPSTETFDHLVPYKELKKKNKKIHREHSCVLACVLCNGHKGHQSSFEYLGLKWMRYMFADAAGKAIERKHWLERILSWL